MSPSQSQLCAEYESLWQSIRPPEIDSFLSRTADADRVELLDALKRIELKYLERFRATAVVDTHREPAQTDRESPTSGKDTSVLETVELSHREPVSEPEPDGDASIEATLGVSLDPTRDFAPQGGQPDPARDSNQATVGMRYVNLRPHARGGLGQVSIAHDTELNRDVALKEIQTRFADDPSNQKRFEMEAKVTGRLEHPGIVPIYGFGIQSDGRQYYAMRFIQGDSLKDAIEQFHLRASSPDYRSMEFRDLLRRFVDVCNAVEFAHKHRVIHRDIKPANVMLGDFGETLLVDWGLAKSLSSESLDDEIDKRRRASIDDAMATADGSRVGTPAYMSPEQAEGNSATIGEASDIYSLGATLYHLLTGVVPFAGADVLEILKLVQHGQFESPHLRQPTVPRPLSAICSNAMSLEISARYDSAAQLARDVERFMADEPVSAWREPLGTRVRRWTRRHRTLVSSSLVGLLIALASLIVILVQQNRTNQELSLAYDRQQAATKEAEDQFGLAMEAIRGYHLGVAEDFLLQQEEFSGLRSTLLKSPRQFYGQLTDLINSKEEPSPEQRVALFDAFYQMADLSMAVGDRKDSLDYCDQALAISSDLIEQNPGHFSYQLKHALVLLDRSEILRAMGRVDEAEESLELAEETLTHVAQGRESDVELAKLLFRVSQSRANLTANERPSLDAEPYFQESVSRAKRVCQMVPDSEERAQDLGIILLEHSAYASNKGDSARAETIAREAVEIQRRLVVQAPTDPDRVFWLASSLNNLGNYLDELERFDEAAEAFEEAEPLFRLLVQEGPNVADFRSGLASILNNLGMLYTTFERRDEAEIRYLESLRIKERMVEDFPLVIEYRVSLGGGYSNFAAFVRLGGDNEGAIEWHDRSIDALMQTLEIVPDNATATFFAQQAFMNRAMTNVAIGRQLEAAADFENGARYTADPELKLKVNIEQALALVRGGDYDGAVAVVDQFVETDTNDTNYYYMALVYAFASRLVEDNGGLAEEEQQEKITRYCAQAVNTLRRLYATGAINQGQFLATLKTPDFSQVFSDQEAFQQLLQEFEDEM